MKPLANKTVWITGASSGIGEALAYDLARQGARLILTARNEKELHRVRAACHAPDLHAVVPLDLGDYHQLEARAEEVWDTRGPIDVLVNNAGVSQRYLGLESSLELDEKIMNVNFFGTTALTRPIARRMVARGAGHLAVVSSVLGLYGIQTRTAYAASKHALRGYFDSLRSELAHTPVKVTVIYPGYITTRVSENALNAQGQPHGRVDEGHSHGISAEACARRIVAALEADESEVIIAGAKEWAGVLLSRYLPGLFRRLSPASRSESRARAHDSKDTVPRHDGLGEACLEQRLEFGVERNDAFGR